MSDDGGRHPSDGLVPDLDEVADTDQLDPETPDALGEPMDEAYLENELPEEGISPEDVAFEEDLERGSQEGAPEGGVVSDRGGERSGDEYAQRDYG